MREWTVLARVASGIAFAVAAEPLRVRVVPNGATHAEIPATVSADSWGALRAGVEALEPLGRLLHQDPKQEWWLADANGTRLESWDDLARVPGPEPLLTAVPSGRPYQWGPRAVGKRFLVPVSDRDGVELETVAHSPRVFLIHNLLSEEESMKLIEQAGEKTGEYALATSGVGFKTFGARNKENTRTSASAFDTDSPIAKRILKRAFEVARIPMQQTMADGLQILRYQEGQAYISHLDWFPPETGVGKQQFNPEKEGGSNRYATVFLYLWSPPSGGYTVFPKARVEADLVDSLFVSTGRDKVAAEKAMIQARAFYKDGAWELKQVQECYEQLAVKPMKQGAALFYHQDPLTGRLLQEAVHGACPSLTGTKWGANLWIWNTARHLSQGGSAPTSVSADFRNLESEALELSYSMDGGSSWVVFGTVQPGRSQGSSTFGGHMWRFARPGGGTEVQRWTMPTGEGQVSTMFTSRSSRPQVDKPEKEL